MTPFRIGNLYFRIQFADRERLLLIPTAMIFVGKNILPRATKHCELSSDLWYFQDPRSYHEHGAPDFLEQSREETTKRELRRPEDDQLTAELFALPIESLDEVVDCDALAENAVECAKRRQTQGLAQLE